MEREVERYDVRARLKVQNYRMFDDFLSVIQKFLKRGKLRWELHVTNCCIFWFDDCVLGFKRIEGIAGLHMSPLPFSFTSHIKSKMEDLFHGCPSEGCRLEETQEDILFESY